jgi:hypothetical protein
MASMSRVELPWPRVTTEAQVEEFLRTGVVVVPGILDEEELRAARAGLHVRTPLACCLPPRVALLALPPVACLCSGPRAATVEYATARLRALPVREAPQSQTSHRRRCGAAG